MWTTGGGGRVLRLKNILVMKIKIISKQKPGAEGLPAERKGMWERTGSGRRAGRRKEDKRWTHTLTCTYVYICLYTYVCIYMYRHGRAHTHTHVQLWKKCKETTAKISVFLTLLFIGMCSSKVNIFVSFLFSLFKLLIFLQNSK